MTSAVESPEALDLDRVLAVLGPVAGVSYAPPNIYPMSAPRFTTGSGAERPRPSGSDLGVYVHVPFCSYHCSFCFYATKIGAELAQKQRYVDGLCRELEWLPEGNRLTQLYVGGGTPTSLPPALLARVLEAVVGRLGRAGAHVHTVEASPETLTAEHVAVLQTHGIERVSMGVQSLDDGVLDTVKRRHTRPMVEAACRLLVESGRMVNIDLIYGLPGQTPERFRGDLEAIAALGVHSITTYNLRVNERTPVARSLAEHERLDLANLVRWRAAVSAAARDLGFAPKRWHTFQRTQVRGPAGPIVERFDDVTGHGEQWSVGMSARSRLDDVVYRNHPSYDTYLERIEGGRSPVEEMFPLAEHERKLRFLALTLGDGRTLSRAAYEAEFAGPIAGDFPEPLARLADVGLLATTGDAVALTATGQLVYDLVMRAFYPETVRRWMEERQALAKTAGNLRPRAQAATAGTSP